MSLNRLWQMSYDSKLIDVIRNSHDAIPIIQAFHLIGITLLLGAMIILNFRMLGLGFGQIQMAVLAKQVWSWGTGGLLVAIAAGFVVFIADPARYAANYSFVTKMSLLLAAIVYQYTFYRKTVRAEAAATEPQTLRLVPIVSLLLWFGVAWRAGASRSLVDRISDEGDRMRQPVTTKRDWGKGVGARRLAYRDADAGYIRRR